MRSAFFMATHLIRHLVKQKTEQAVKNGPVKLPEISWEQQQLNNIAANRAATEQAARNGELPTRKVKKPRSKWTKEQRDAAVEANIYPTRDEVTNNADFRGITGDIQAGQKGLAIRMESRLGYKQAQTGLENPKSKDPKIFAPHHRMGVQDTQAFVAGKSPEQMTAMRSTLETGGLYIGNVKENYESLYDGVLTKAGRDAGMNSPDHRNVHDRIDEAHAKMGIEVNPKDRSLDKFNGELIKDLPEDQQLSLLLRMGWIDELIIDQVQTERFEAFMRKYGHLSDAERREIILKKPHLYGNAPLDT